LYDNKNGDYFCSPKLNEVVNRWNSVPNSVPVPCARGKDL